MIACQCQVCHCQMSDVKACHAILFLQQLEVMLPCGVVWRGKVQDTKTDQKSALFILPVLAMFCLAPEKLEQVATGLVSRLLYMWSSSPLSATSQAPILRLCSLFWHYADHQKCCHRIFFWGQCHHLLFSRRGNLGRHPKDWQAPSSQSFSLWP